MMLHLHVGDNNDNVKLTWRWYTNPRIHAALHYASRETDAFDVILFQI